jgi:hypothetical protein
MMNELIHDRIKEVKEVLNNLRGFL